MVFTGLDDIDWNSLEHAYGPAGDVPDVLRALVSEDPAVREQALDAMYGAVHHQGSSYTGTVAAIPFLVRIVEHTGLPGRAEVLELLASIGGGYPQDDVERQAVRAVAAALPVFATALADPDPAVRAAACGVLPVCTAKTRAARALVDRLRVETDTGALTAAVTALGALGDRPGVAAALADVLVHHTDHTARLAALTELVRVAPDALPADTAALVPDLLVRASADEVPPPAPAGFSTPTLLGAVRERAEQRPTRPAVDTAALLTGLNRVLDDRVEDRARLLAPLLTAAAPGLRHDAVVAAGDLVENWRGDHRDLVRLVGLQLLAPEPHLPPAAAGTLRHLGDLAAPAADALARALELAPRRAEAGDGPPPWLVLWEDEPPVVGPTLCALAALGDQRAREPVRWALEAPDLPSDIGHAVRGLGRAAADLVPLIRGRLRDLPAGECRDGLVAALGGLGAAAAPAVPDLVALLPDPGALRALAALGHHAAAAAPVLRHLVEHVEPAAAVALWRVTGDADRVLPVLLRRSADADAVRTLGELGPAAPVRTLRHLLDHPEVRLDAAEALCRATGDAEAVLPVLTGAWDDEDVHVRTRVARCLADLGPAAAPAAPLPRAELAHRRRRTSRDDPWGDDRVRADEELLRACRAAVAAVLRG